MIKLINLIGARPQIIKAAAISRAIRKNCSTTIEDIVVHTGQHYDLDMSGHFFEQLNIPLPKHNLQCGSLSHARQTALIMERIETVFHDEKPDFLLVYGDTNSTLAAALVAIKMQIEVIHVEAGLRSFNKTMPEEVNRILCDHISTLLFCPTTTAVQNLIKEGFSENTPGPYSPDKPGVLHSGDIMYDNSLYFAEIASKKSTVLERLELNNNPFILLTLHRDLNTDSKTRLNNIFLAILQYTKEKKCKIVFPVHPRTKKMMDHLLSEELKKELISQPYLILTEPLDFFDITQLEKHCQMVITDSGGVQKEAFFFKKPCIVLRPETEWVELIKSGYAILADANKNKILEALMEFPGKVKPSYTSLYGTGNAAELICASIIQQFKKRITIS